MKKLIWFHNRQCRISKAIVYLDKMEAEMAHLEIDLIDEIVLHVGDATTLNQILKIQEHFCAKIDRLTSNKWDDAVIKVLLVRLLPMRKLRSILLFCNIEAWFAEMLRELHIVDVEHIDLCAIEHISDNTMHAIAECCPELLSFKSDNSRGALTHSSLVALSDRRLPHTEFYYPKWIPIPTAAIASQCAYTLSRIHSIQTPAAATTPALYSAAIPYLSNLHTLVLSSPIDHLLLSVFAQHAPPIETLKYLRGSSATADSLLQIVRTVGRTLRTLVLQPLTDIVADELIVSLFPHCPQLTALKIGTWHYDRPTERVTDASLLALSEHCRLLKELYIVKCSAVTEAALLRLITSCPHITELHLPLGSLSEDTVLALPATSHENNVELPLHFNASR